MVPTKSKIDNHIHQQSRMFSAKSCSVETKLRLQDMLHLLLSPLQYSNCKPTGEEKIRKNGLWKAKPLLGLKSWHQSFSFFSRKTGGTGRPVSVIALVETTAECHFMKNECEGF